MKKSIYKNMILGVAYYPEHWEKKLWEDDIIRMKEHGINLLRIADFAWAKYEPLEGQYQINYFDDFLTLCEKHKIDVIICTPTAAPPMWLIEKYPEVLNCDIEGKPYYGPRRHYNYNSPVYQEKCAKLVEKMVIHYKDYECIVGWQIDNELNCDLSEFYSEADHLAFKKYLKTKYKTLEAVNEALGLTFWSRSYTSWDEVTLNRKNVGGAINPHIALEEKRFFSLSAVNFCKLQLDVIKKHLTRGEFITTNGLFANLDYNELMDTGLDFITFDSYPNFAFDLDNDPKSKGNLNDRKWSWNLMWTRSVSPVFGIMEQQAGANGWTSRMQTPMPKPGQMRLWTLQSVAHGADLVAYFRWRTSPMGCEIYWHGLNDYSNKDNRRLRELKDVASDMRKLEVLRGSTYKAKLAILKDYSNVWDAQSDGWHGRIDYYSDNSWFVASQLTHTPCDFYYLRKETKLSDIEKYDVLVYPHAAIMNEEISSLLKDFVNNGGMLIFGARTGYKNDTGLCPMRDMPGLISEWMGIRVEDYTLVGPGDDPVRIKVNNESLSAPLFNEVLEVIDEEVEVLASFENNYYAGKPAMVSKKIGKGVVYYLGSCFGIDSAKYLLQLTGLVSPYQSFVEVPETVELAVRTDGKYEFIFLLNYSAKNQVINVKETCLEVLTDTKISGKVTLKAYEVKVLKRSL